MTPQERKVMELALEALTHIRPSALTSFYTIGDRDKAIIAIKEALAQLEQDEVDIRSRLYQRIHELETQLAQPEQEPLTGGDERRHIICLCPDCTTPPQRKPPTDAALHLSNLVEALDNAFISSWQSTHHWQKQLDDAREYLTAHGIKE